MVDTMEMPFEYELQDDVVTPQPVREPVNIATYVRNDIAARIQTGRGYDTDTLWSLYQKTLDLAIYLRKLILERDE